MAPKPFLLFALFSITLLVHGWTNSREKDRFVLNAAFPNDVGRGLGAPHQAPHFRSGRRPLPRTRCRCSVPEDQPLLTLRLRALQFLQRCLPDSLHGFPVGNLSAPTFRIVEIDFPRSRLKTSKLRPVPTGEWKGAQTFLFSG